MNIKGIDQNFVNKLNETNPDKKNGLSDELLEGVDVKKVNAMFKLSIDKFNQMDENSPLSCDQSTDDCRWDQWGRTGWP